MNNKEAIKILKRLFGKLPVDDQFDMTLVIEAIERNERLNKYVFIGSGIFLIGFFMGLALIVTKR